MAKLKRLYGFDSKCWKCKKIRSGVSYCMVCLTYTCGKSDCKCQHPKSDHSKKKGRGK